MEDSTLMIETLFQHASLGIIIANRAGQITRINPYAEKLFGYEAAELINQDIETLLPMELRKKHVGLRVGYNNDPIPREMGKSLDLLALKKDGSTFSVEISLSSYHIAKELFIVSFINDVTQRKKGREELENKVQERTRELSQALEELNHTNDNLEAEIRQRKDAEEKMRQTLEREKELNELKSRFVSMASHEFRTPLAGILTSASLIGRYHLPEQEEKKLKQVKNIKKSVHNLTTILNDFLSLDKLNQGKIQARLSRFELKDLIQEVLEDMRGISEQSHSLVYQPQHQELALYQYTEMLRNILMNLLSNGMKYSENGTEIKVFSKVEQANVKIAVQDQGLGIPEEDKKHMFERFFRAKNVTAIQGTGLGLNIVKRYLDFMQGSITFTSQLNQGSTFTITFPQDVQS